MLLLSDITLHEGWLCNLSLLHFTHSLSFIRLLADTYFEVPRSRPTSILQKLFLETAVLYMLFFMSVWALESKLFVVRTPDETELAGNAAGVMRRCLSLRWCCSMVEAKMGSLSRWLVVLPVRCCHDHKLLHHKEVSVPLCVRHVQACPLATRKTVPLFWFCQRERAYICNTAPWSQIGTPKTTLTATKNGNQYLRHESNVLSVSLHKCMCICCAIFHFLIFL